MTKTAMLGLFLILNFYLSIVECFGALTIRNCTSSGNCIDIYRPHPKDGEASVFSLFTTLGGGGGYPSPRFFPWFLVAGTFLGLPQSWLGGTPVLAMGVPQSQSQTGVLQSWLGGGYPRTGYPPGLRYPHGQDWVPPLPPGQVMLWAVCLVRFHVGRLSCYGDALGSVHAH